MRRAQPATPVPSRRETGRQRRGERHDNEEALSASKKSKDFFEGMHGKQDSIPSELSPYFP